MTQLLPRYDLLHRLCSRCWRVDNFMLSRIMVCACIYVALVQLKGVQYSLFTALCVAVLYGH